MKEKITCFLIDDDPDDHEFFLHAIDELQREIECFFASDGVKAVRKLKEEQHFTPDYIFLDLNMPLMDGKACLREIKKLDRVKDIPVIICSTSTRPEDKKDALRLGATAYLVKESSIGLLREKLHAIFEGRGAIR